MTEELSQVSVRLVQSSAIGLGQRRVSGGPAPDGMKKLFGLPCSQRSRSHPDVCGTKCGGVPAAWGRDPPRRAAPTRRAVTLASTALAKPTNGAAWSGRVFIAGGFADAAFDLPRSRRLGAEPPSPPHSPKIFVPILRLLSFSGATSTFFARSRGRGTLLAEDVSALQRRDASASFVREKARRPSRRRSVACSNRRVACSNRPCSRASPVPSLASIQECSPGSHRRRLPFPGPRRSSSSGRES